MARFVDIDEWTLIRAQWLLLALLGAGCTPLIQAPQHAGDVTVEGAHGRLTPSQSDAVVAKAVATAPDPEATKKLVALMETLSSEPLYKDNSVKLLVDGPATYRAMLAAIESADRYIELETYIFSDDEVGKKFAQLLSQKAATGVRVTVLYDSIGSLGAPTGFFDDMSAAGVEVIAFNPANPVTGGNPMSINNRDHRKLLIVDDRVAFTGGINIDRNYSSSSISDRQNKKPRGWRDTHIEIRGPAVAGCHALFLANWQRVGGEMPVAPTSGATDVVAKDEGDELVRILSSVGGQGKISPIRIAYELAIESATERVWITQPYFAPDPAFLKTLAAAARRGIDVRILLPGTSDSAISLYSSRYRYGGLLKAGVRIYESEDTMVHAKTAVIDGIWSTVGSSNLDYRSFIHNDEVNAVVVGANFAKELEAVSRSRFGDQQRDHTRAMETTLAHEPLEGSVREYWYLLVVGVISPAR